MPPVRRTFLAALALVASLACEPGILGPPVPTDFDAVPMRVTLAGEELALEAELWRSGGFIAPTTGPRLSAFMRIRTVDGSAVPDNIRADVAWLLHGDEVWGTRVVDQWPRVFTLPWFDVSAPDGPDWPDGASVVVVVRVRETTGRRYLLRAPVTTIRTAS